MKVELRTERSTDNPVETAIMAARGDYREDSLVGTTFEEVMAGTDKDKAEFIEHMISRGHWGPLEHPQAFFAVEGISRVTMAQITRHRLMSFDVQSMRYVDFEDADVAVPDSMEGVTTLPADEQPDIDGVTQRDITAREEYNAAVHDLFQRYERMVEAGVPEEDARYILPLGTKVNLSVSGNLRAWLHVLDLRHSGAAQWEVRELSEQIIEELREWAPLVIETWEQKAKNNSIKAP
jgi:thymidylate synthase (FAD)